MNLVNGVFWQSVDQLLHSSSLARILAAFTLVQPRVPRVRSIHSTARLLQQNGRILLHLKCGARLVRISDEAEYDHFVAPVLLSSD